MARIKHVGHYLIIKEVKEKDTSNTPFTLCILQSGESLSATIYSFQVSLDLTQLS